MTPRFAEGRGAAALQAIDEFAAVAGSWDLRISTAQAGDGVGVAAGERDLAMARGKSLGVAVCNRQHLAVQDFDGGKILGEVVEVGCRARAGESGEGVVDRE